MYTLLHYRYLVSETQENNLLNQRWNVLEQGLVIVQMKNIKEKV